MAHLNWGIVGWSVLARGARPWGALTLRPGVGRDLRCPQCYIAVGLPASRPLSEPQSLTGHKASSLCLHNSGSDSDIRKGTRRALTAQVTAGRVAAGATSVGGDGGGSTARSLPAPSAPSPRPLAPAWAWGGSWTYPTPARMPPSPSATACALLHACRHPEAAAPAGPPVPSGLR